MYKNNYEVQILVNGKPVREYNKDGRVYVQGNEGSRYDIRVKNNSGKRIKAVIYVDGNSVLNDANDDSGYVISPYDDLKLEGFRLSDDTVAAFRFSKAGESRAQLVHGDSKNCGVIGVRVISEKESPPVKIIKEHHYHKNPWPPYKPYHPWWETRITWSQPDTLGVNDTDCVYANNVSLDSPQMEMDNGGASACYASFDLGTEMGEDIHSKVVSTSFESGTVEAEFSIYYATRRGLIDMEIDLGKKKQVHIPQAFGNYCKRP